MIVKRIFYKKYTIYIFCTLVKNKLASGVGLAPTDIVLRTAILSLFVFHYYLDKNLIAVISYLKHTPPIKLVVMEGLAPSPLSL